MTEIKIKLLSGAKIPEYQTSGAAGADISALLIEPMTIDPGARAAVPTGLFVEIPAGYEIQIRPRSGLALKHGVTLLNTPGTIDEDYRGEIKIIMINLGSEPFTVTNGMRIAQMIASKVERISFTAASSLSSTARDDGGFGHSGE
jgi:dUTP pyrophosphatase